MLVNDRIIIRSKGNLSQCCVFHVQATPKELICIIRAVLKQGVPLEHLNISLDGNLADIERFERTIP